jgi:hypothetical protein
MEEEWKNGKVEEWKRGGRMEGWKRGGVEGKKTAEYRIMNRRISKARVRGLYFLRYSAVHDSMVGGSRSPAGANHGGKKHVGPPLLSVRSLLAKEDAARLLAATETST